MKSYLSLVFGRIFEDLVRNLKIWKSSIVWCSESIFFLRNSKICNLMFLFVSLLWLSIYFWVSFVDLYSSENFSILCNLYNLLAYNCSEYFFTNLFISGGCSILHYFVPDFRGFMLLYFTVFNVFSAAYSIDFHSSIYKFLLSSLVLGLVCYFVYILKKSAYYITEFCSNTGIQNH